MSNSPLPYGTPITLAQAQTAVAAAAEEARKNGWSMAIAVVDCGGNLVAFARMDGTQIGSTDVAIAKAKAANNFKRSTRVMDESVTAAGPGLRLLAIPGILPIEGGELIVRGGTIIGAIGVSGSLSANDLQTAVAGANASF